MLARAHATTTGASADLLTPPPAHKNGEASRALLLARYADIILVVAAAPVVLLANLPLFGYVLGAGGWIVIRFAAEIVKRRAWSARDTRSRALLHLTAILGRVWLIAAVILIARFVGHNSDGITAAAIVLVAFTVEFMVSIVLRDSLAADAGGRR